MGRAQTVSIKRLFPDAIGAAGKSSARPPFEVVSATLVPIAFLSLHPLLPPIPGSPLLFLTYLPSRPQRSPASPRFSTSPSSQVGTRALALNHPPLLPLSSWPDPELLEAPRASHLLVIPADFFFFFLHISTLSSRKPSFEI